jgi:hypothetical protein
MVNRFQSDLHAVLICDYQHPKDIKIQTRNLNLTELTQAKGLIQGPSARRTKDLLKLNRDQLRWVVGLLTGHCHLKDTF